MKEDNDIFKKFRDSFSKIDGHFHILEQRVLGVQVERGIPQQPQLCTRRTADGIF